jgi:CRISPR/Cas system endoribonuclease Cas6 (RAMP superfamily)
MSIRSEYPTLAEDVALLRAGDNDLAQVVAGSVHSDGVTGNVTYRVAGPGERTYAQALEELAREEAEGRDG